jgi:hypothetical protein
MTVLGKARGLVGRALGNQLLLEQIEESKILTAKLLIAQMKPNLARLRDAEFKVFSQFGDDGIIQYLIRELAPLPDSFIEFGVESYRESNTRFLLMNDNWRGLVLDGSADHMAGLRGDKLYWRHDITAVNAFIDRENVNALFRENGFAGPIGILSIDIDGNDYWVWEAIDSVDPAIVIVEYNSVFGPSLDVSIPYDAAFMRSKAHHSHLYWGASLKALCRLSEKKGFSFVGSNSAGNNAYFVRKDKLGALKPLTSEEGWVSSRFREARDASGELTFLGGEARLQVIRDLPLNDFPAGRVRKLAELL